MKQLCEQLCDPVLQVKTIYFQNSIHFLPIYEKQDTLRSHHIEIKDFSVIKLLVFLNFNPTK